jgi:hypothetical protein
MNCRTSSMSTFIERFFDLLINTHAGCFGSRDDIGTQLGGGPDVESPGETFAGSNSSFLAWLQANLKRRSNHLRILAKVPSRFFFKRMPDRVAGGLSPRPRTSNVTFRSLPSVGICLGENRQRQDSGTGDSHPMSSRPCRERTAHISTSVAARLGSALGSAKGIP